MVEVTRHAINRFRARSTDASGMTNGDIARVIRQLVKNASSMKVTANGQILVSDEWILIRSEETILTVYKGSIETILHKRVKGKHDASDPTSGDPPIRKRKYKRRWNRTD